MLAGSVFTLLLAIACLSDLRTRRIPNGVTGALVVLGFSYNIGVGGFGAGLLHGAGGLLAGLAFWLPFWLLGWLGAGDVKLFAGAATWLGAWAAVQAAGVSAVIGAILTLAWLGWDRGLRVAVEKSLVAMIHPKVLTSPSVTTNDRRRLVPYGLALTTGLLVVFWLPGLIPL
jgi:prepilin peptidase CpaA